MATTRKKQKTMFKPLKHCRLQLPAHSQILLAFISFFFVSTSESKTIDFALNWKPEPEFGGFYEAERQGYFKDEGLDVTILPGGAGQPTAQLLASQKARYAVTTGQELLQFNDKGIPLVSLFTVYQKNPHALMVRKSRGIKTIKELMESDGTIALEIGAMYVKWIKQKTLNGKASKAKLVPYTGGIQMFLKDPSFAQQCFLFSEPLAVKFSGNQPPIDVEILPIADTGFDPYEAVVAVHKDTIESSKEEVQKFQRAITRGWTSYLADPKLTNEAMLKLSPGATSGFYAQYAAIQKPYIQADPVGKQETLHWKRTAEQLIELGLIKKAPPASSIVFP